MKRDCKVRNTIFTMLLVLAVFGAFPALAAQIEVTNTSDDGPGSLRQAVRGAFPGDEIVFSMDFSTPQTITLTTGTLVVNKDLTITGPGAARHSTSSTSPSLRHLSPPSTVIPG